MSKRLKWIQDELQNLQDSGLYNRIRTISSPQGAWLVVDGKKETLKTGVMPLPELISYIKSSI